MMDVGNGGEQLKDGLCVNAVITCKTYFLVKSQPVVLSIDFGELVTHITLSYHDFFWKMMVSILSYNNFLIIGLLGEYFKLEMMVPQRSKNATKASNGIMVSLPVYITKSMKDMLDKWMVESLLTSWYN